MNVIFFSTTPHLPSVTFPMVAETHHNLLWEVSVTVVNQNWIVSTNFSASSPSPMLRADRQMKSIQQALFLQHFITHTYTHTSTVKQIKFVFVHAMKYRLTIEAQLHSFPALALGRDGWPVSDPSSFKSQEKYNSVQEQYHIFFHVYSFQ